MNKIVLGVVVAAALAVVGWFFYGQLIAPVEPSFVSTEDDAIEEMDGDTPMAGQPILPGTDIDDIVEDFSGGNTEAAVTVTYTDAGFEPKTVTVEEGEAVRFVNESSRGMWVGSDVHPTHMLYPVKTSLDCLGSAFDACKSVPSGSSWTFTFDAEGSWGYHNHMQARDRGTVIVR